MWEPNYKGTKTCTDCWLPSLAFLLSVMNYFICFNLLQYNWIRPLFAPHFCLYLANICSTFLPKDRNTFYCPLSQHSAAEPHCIKDIQDDTWAQVSKSMICRHKSATWAVPASQWMEEPFFIWAASSRLTQHFSWERRHNQQRLGCMSRTPYLWTTNTLHLWQRSLKLMNPLLQPARLVRRCSLASSEVTSKDDN